MVGRREKSNWSVRGESQSVGRSEKCSREVRGEGRLVGRKGNVFCRKKMKCSM